MAFFFILKFIFGSFQEDLFGPSAPIASPPPAYAPVLTHLGSDLSFYYKYYYCFKGRVGWGGDIGEGFSLGPSSLRYRIAFSSPVYDIIIQIEIEFYCLTCKNFYFLTLCSMPYILLVKSQCFYWQKLKGIEVLQPPQYQNVRSRSVTQRTMNHIGLLR